MEIQGLETNSNVEQQQTQTSIGKIIAGGFAASLVGAVVWALISFYGEYELGILASGIGALVGVAVAYIAKNNVEQTHQVVAVIFGLFGVIAGKYIAYYLMVKQLENEMGLDMQGLVSFSDMFEAIDILWIVLAAVAAWSIPQKMAGRA